MVFVFLQTKNLNVLIDQTFFYFSLLLFKKYPN